VTNGSFLNSLTISSSCSAPRCCAIRFPVLRRPARACRSLAQWQSLSALDFEVVRTFRFNREDLLIIASLAMLAGYTRVLRPV